MTHADALAFWLARIDYERRTPRPGDLKLDRMRSLLRRLGDPHRRVRCVHVAGTKGKGSTSAMLGSILKAAGYRTGLFTSPHLTDVAERVQVDGIPIAPDEIAARMGEVAAAAAEMDAEGDPARSPTFFEVITALGFLHFDCRRVDLAVIEVGLGGKFDSTNVCDPLVSVITNISFDHRAILGNTLGEIAFQKAGIIKRGIPVVSTADHPEAVAVIERVAQEANASLTLIGRDYRWRRDEPAAFVAGPVDVKTSTGSHLALPLALHGQHQGANAAGVVAVVEALRSRGMSIGDNAIRRGLADVVWPARLELMSRGPVVVMDCAHNVASVDALLSTLATTFPVVGRRHLIFAASNDKPIAEMLTMLAPAFDEFHLTRYRSNPRSADPETMREVLQALGVATVRVHATPEEAWSFACGEVGPDDGIVVAGSVFLAGELRPVILASDAASG